MTADKSKTVLLVDDNHSIRYVVGLQFEYAGFICALCKDGAEAVEKASRIKPDIIVLDYSMPGLNGIQVAALLKNQLPMVPIILFTMYGSAGLAKLAIAAGISVVVPKEDGASRLIAKVQELLSLKQKSEESHPTPYTSSPESDNLPQ